MSTKELYEQYRCAVEELRSFNETVGGRELTAEETATEQRVNNSISELHTKITQAVETEERARDLTDIDRRMTALATIPAVPAVADKSEEAQLRRFLNGEIRSVVVTGPERRDLLKGTTTAGGFAVPTGFYDRLMDHLIEVSSILDAGATVLRTTSGETMQIPKTTAYGAAAIVAEGAAIPESDPTFGQASLGAYKYGRMVQISNELIDDSAVDILGLIARDCGRSIGNLFGAHTITGTGTGQPTGIAVSATTGVTGGAGVAGAFTADNLIDLYYSVIAPYRNSPAAAWLMRDASIASIRKIKDTTNQYIWQPSMALGVPETLLGKPIYTDPNMPAVALSARSVLFGDISTYYVRVVNELRFERSDDFAFANDLVTFRCLFRADGLLVDQTGAVKAFVGNAA